jgi:hypothetical protein
MIDFTAGLDMASRRSTRRQPVRAPPPGPSSSTRWTTDSGARPTVNNKFACAVSTTVELGRILPAPTPGLFTVNFDGNTLVNANSGVNLRALFVNSDGVKVGSILSPDGHAVTTTTTATPTNTGQVTTGNIPEPALLSMLGLGLVGAAYRSRRRS